MRLVKVVGTSREDDGVSVDCVRKEGGGAVMLGKALVLLEASARCSAPKIGVKVFISHSSEYEHSELARERLDPRGLCGGSSQVSQAAQHIQ